MPRLTECGTGFCNPSLPSSQLEVRLSNRCVGISAEKRERTWTNTKGKHVPLKGILREGGLKRTLLCHTTIPSQSAPRILPVHDFLFGTRYKISEGSIMTEGILSFCVSSLSTMQSEKQSDSQYFEKFVSLILMHDT